MIRHSALGLAMHHDNAAQTLFVRGLFDTWRLARTFTNTPGRHTSISTLFDEAFVFDEAFDFSTDFC